MNAPQLFDYQGLICPEPVIRLHALLKAEKPEKLDILVDNEAAEENIRRALAHYGYTTETTFDGIIWHLNAQYTNTEGTHIENSNYVRQINTQTKKTVVLITTELLGQGDATLGERLMESFLATLPEMGDELWRIILLNGAAKLVAKEGKCLESLKKLEASGITILVCGACLTFYGLMGSKVVGDTTNMLDVITSLDLADKVITL